MRTEKYLYFHATERNNLSLKNMGTSADSILVHSSHCVGTVQIPEFFSNFLIFLSTSTYFYLSYAILRVYVFIIVKNECFLIF